jgi:hypothetical protein
MIYQSAVAATCGNSFVKEKEVRSNLSSDSSSVEKEEIRGGSLK